MTTVAIAPPVPASKPAARGWIARNFWGMGDQALLSISNLVTMVLAARAMSQELFGVFTLAYSGLLFVNIFQSTLVCQPHNVLGTVRSGEDYRRYTGSTFISQIALALALGLSGAGLATVAWARGLAWAAMLWTLAGTILAWQFQEFVRRVLYTEHRLQAAFWNDLVAYGGRTAAVVWLFMADKLDEVTSFHAITVATAPAALLGLWQIRRSMTWHVDRLAWRENWKFGKWLTGAEVLNWCSSLHAVLFLAAAVLGPAASGALKAAQIIFGPTRVLSFYLGSILPIRFTRTLSGSGEGGLRKHVRSVYGLVVPVLGGYCLVVAMLAGPLLRLLYGDRYEGGATVLMLFAVTAFLSYIQMVLMAALSARHRTRDVFMGYVWGAAITLTLSWPLLAWLGTEGALVAMMLTGVVITVLFWRAFERRERAAASAESVVADDPTGAAERRELLEMALGALEAKGIRYCALHGSEQAVALRGKDLDCLVGATGSDVLAAFEERLKPTGGRVAQWLVDGSDYIAVSRPGADGACVVPLHLSPDYRMSDRVFYEAEEILESRRRVNGWWAPAPAMEFGCVLVNRIAKGELRLDHERRLSELFAEDPAGCREQIARFFDAAHSKVLKEAAASGDWDAARSSIDELRAAMLRRSLPGQRWSAAGRRISHWLSKIARHVRPRWGLHVVFLGPDGVGKSTVIDAVKRDLSPAFLGTTYGTFAPELLPRGPKASPHALPVRSRPASLLKAGWWLACYTIGYVLGPRLNKARGRLVINHRYFVDAIVDPKRYRYSGPIWLLRAIWRCVPKPDLTIILDAPPEVVQSRKKEVPIGETRRQCEGYRSLARIAPRAHLINADQPPAKVIADVEGVVLDALERRTRRRLGREDRS